MQRWLAAVGKIVAAVKTDDTACRLTTIRGRPSLQAYVPLATIPHPAIGILTNDPITGIGERQYEATDAIVSAVDVDVVGVNYYPHTARTGLSKVLLKTWRRYRKPIMVSETSWHDGHPIHHRRYPGLNKGSWLRHVLDEVEIARQRGAVISGVCWYPIVDCPPWNVPRSRKRWGHGLIRADLSVDHALSVELTNAVRNSPFSGVRPWGWTSIRLLFVGVPDVLILELLRVEIAQR